MPDEEYITVEQAAMESGYGVRHIRYLLNKGRISGKKFGHMWMVPREAVMAYRATDPRPGRPKQSN